MLWSPAKTAASGKALSLSTPWLDSALKRQCFTSPRQTSAMVRQRGASPPLWRRFTSSDRLQNFTARVAAMERSNNDGGFKPRTAAVQWRHKLLDFFSDDPPLIELRSNNSSVTAILVGLFAACRWQNSTAKLLALLGGSSTMVTRWWSFGVAVKGSRTAPLTYTCSFDFMFN